MRPSKKVWSPYRQRVESKTERTELSVRLWDEFKLVCDHKVKVKRFGWERNYHQTKDNLES